MSFRERVQRLRYNYIPDHLIGEILTKRWTDNAIPFLALVITVVGFGTAINGFFKPQSLSDSTRQLGEFSIVVTGLTIVMLGGGIDLSVGSIFALVHLRRRLRLLHLRLAGLGGAGRGGRHRHRLGQPERRPHRLYAAARLPHHSGHLHHRPRALRHIGGEFRRPDPDVDACRRISGISSATGRSSASPSASSPRSWSRSSPISPSPARGPAGMCWRSAAPAARPTIPASGSGARCS